MSYRGYELFYVNGSSHSEGGGFIEDCIDNNYKTAVKDFYKTTYNITWKSVNDFVWPSVLANRLKIPVVNEAACGGGSDRVIRMSYEFLEKNWNQRNQLFLLLELPSISRQEIYYNPHKKYFIINDQFEQQGEDIFYKFVSASYDYKTKMTDVTADNDLEFYHRQFHNKFEYVKNLERKIIGLYSFCKQHSISIKLMTNLYKNGWTSYYSDFFQKEDIVSYNTNDYEVSSWCYAKKLTVADETKGTLNDGHPGYFGHQYYAEFIGRWLAAHLTPAINR